MSCQSIETPDVFVFREKCKYSDGFSFLFIMHTNYIHAGIDGIARHLTSESINHLYNGNGQVQQTGADTEIKSLRLESLVIVNLSNK